MLQNFLLPQGSSYNVLYKLIHVWKCLKAEMTHFSLIIQSFLDASTSDSQLSPEDPLCRIYDGMDPGCQWHCGHCSELIFFLCAILFKVHDSSFWLSPGASAIHAIQCGDPTTEPTYLQFEEPGGEGSSQEEVVQETQAYLLSRALLHPH